MIFFLLDVVFALLAEAAPPEEEAPPEEGAPQEEGAPPEEGAQPEEGAPQEECAPQDERGSSSSDMDDIVPLGQPGFAVCSPVFLTQILRAFFTVSHGSIDMTFFLARSAANEGNCNWEL